MTFTLQKKPTRNKNSNIGFGIAQGLCLHVAFAGWSFLFTVIALSRSRFFCLVKVQKFPRTSQQRVKSQFWITKHLQTQKIINSNAVRFCKPYQTDWNWTIQYVFIFCLSASSIFAFLVPQSSRNETLKTRKEKSSFPLTRHIAQIGR